MTEYEYDTEDGGVERRTFLKATGVAGVGSISFDPDDLIGEPDFGRVTFAEVGVEHEVHSSPSGGRYDADHVDEVVRHAIDTANGQLYLKQSAPRAGIDAFRRDTVIAADSYRSLPTTLFGGQVAEGIVVETGKSYRTKEALKPVDGYALPAVDVDGDGDEVAISTDSRQETVPAGSERTFSLGTREVELRVVESTGETVDRPDIPEIRRAIEEVERVETGTIEPKLKVRNYGKLDAIDATDRHVVPEISR
jgi:hypothetical protein